MEPHTSKTTAKDFFLHLGVMATLYAGTIALLNLLFTVINVAYPQIDQYFFGVSSISFPVATLIVVFPLFLFLANTVRKSYEVDPSKKESAVRKWLMYITLFIAGAIITSDLITLIYYFLDGRELTAGFFLKILAVLVVSGSIFGYFMDDLRNRLTGSRRMIWRVVAAVLVLGSIVLGFVVIGSPQSQRLVRYDDQKINDLRMIQSQVVQYWQSKKAIPATLNDLRDPISGFTIPTDPQSQKEYSYRKTGDVSFELCAEFNLKTSSTEEKVRMQKSPVYYEGMIDENWAHEKGTACFQRTIDPDRYPPFSKPIF